MTLDRNLQPVHFRNPNVSPTQLLEPGWRWEHQPQQQQVGNSNDGGDATNDGWSLDFDSSFVDKDGWEYSNSQWPVINNNINTTNTSTPPTNRHHGHHTTHHLGGTADGGGGGVQWYYSGSHSQNAALVRRRKWIRTMIREMTLDEIAALPKTGEYSIVGESGIDAEIAKFTNTVRDAFRNVTLKSQRPNILLLGGSGAGKSSLVNAVFGTVLAEIGEGRPITQTYSKFTREDIPVVIYDSKGIEHGYIREGFVADTRTFFKKLQHEPALENHVHVVWYIIDLTQARFQPFEADFCMKELKDIPIIFVLNKADTVRMQIVETMRNLILSFNMPNCKAVFHTVSNCKNFETKQCIECGSEKIRKRLRDGTCTIMCKECNSTRLLEKTMGIDELARATVSQMPDLVRHVFMQSQQAEMQECTTKSIRIIEQYATSKDASLRRSDAMASRLTEMATCLVSLYHVDLFSNVASRELSRRFSQIYKQQRISRKITLLLTDLFTGKGITAAIYAVSGLEICKAIVRFKHEVLQQSFLRHDIQRQQQQPPIPPQISSPSLDSISSQIESTPLAAPATDENNNGVSVTPTRNSSSSSSSSTSAAMIEDVEPDYAALLNQLKIEITEEEVLRVAAEIKRMGGVSAYLSQPGMFFS